MFVNEDIVTFYTHTHTRAPGNTRCVVVSLNFLYINTMVHEPFAYSKKKERKKERTL